MSKILSICRLPVSSNPLFALFLKGSQKDRSHFRVPLFRGRQQIFEGNLKSINTVFRGTYLVCLSGVDMIGLFVGTQAETVYGLFGHPKVVKMLENGSGFP